MWLWGSRFLKGRLKHEVLQENAVRTFIGITTNMIKLIGVGMTALSVLSGCMLDPVRTGFPTGDDSLCGPRCLSVYAEVRGRKAPHQIKDIYAIVGREVGEPVSMLELKNAALQLGFSAEGRLLDPNELEVLETYAILPVGRSEGSMSNPLHFVLVRFTNGQAFSVDYQTLEAMPLKISSLKRIWRGHALLLRE